MLLVTVFRLHVSAVDADGLMSQQSSERQTRRNDVLGQYPSQTLPVPHDAYYQVFSRISNCIQDTHYYRRQRVEFPQLLAKTELSRLADTSTRNSTHPLHSTYTHLRKCLLEARYAQRGPLQTAFRPRYSLPAQQQLRFRHAHDQPSSSNSRGRPMLLEPFLLAKQLFAMLPQLLHKLPPTPHRARKPSLHGTTSLLFAERAEGLVKVAL